MSSSNASLAVVVCTWNRKARLQQTLDALGAQELPSGKPLQVIVVDNNSIDGTGDSVRQRQANWRAGKLYYCFEARQGKQFALNTGIALARELGATVLAFTDDDIDMPADWAMQVLAEFDEIEADLIGGKTLVQWPNGGPPPWYDASMHAVVGGVDLGKQRLLLPPDGYAPAGANMAARLTLIDRIGDFSESHFRHMDFEFGRRAATQGARVAYTPHVVVHAPVEEEVLSRRYFRRWSFKAGFSHWAERDPKLSHWLWVPRWVWLQMVKDAGQLMLLTLQRAALNDRFRLELRLWRNWGRICSHWVSRWNPSGYSAWVAERAQKKANLY
jgi:glucosyl-dolichyl phosphate glucuronosyltransferase